jgi:predicted nucleotidyltransferase component of viral defense system
MKTSVDIVEKDYYVTLILHELAKTKFPVVFKGGTSLSKAYHVIDRFSEDIDITFTEHLGESRRKKLKYDILKPIGDVLGLEIKNWHSIESDKDYNHYDFYYPTVNDENMTETVTAFVKLETALMSYSFPVEEKRISNYIYEALSNDEPDLVKMYELIPFSMKVQSLSRTLVDKMFAVCDYYLLDKPRRNARHLYDIYKLAPYVKVDDEFRGLVNDVRKHRLNMGDTYAPAAKESVDIPKLAKKIYDTDFYREDYVDTTLKLISEHLEYEKVINFYEKFVNDIFKIT